MMHLYIFVRAFLQFDIMHRHLSVTFKTRKHVKGIYDVTQRQHTPTRITLIDVAVSLLFYLKICRFILGPSVCV